MNCDQVERGLDDYLDGVLGVDESRALEAHLGDCPECAGSFGALIATVRELEALPAPQCPTDLLPEVMGRLEDRRVVERVVPAHQVGWALGLAGAISTALMLALLPGVVWIAWTALDGLGASMAAALGALPHVGVLLAQGAVIMADAVDEMLKIALALNVMLLVVVLLAIAAWSKRVRVAHIGILA